MENSKNVDVWPETKMPSQSLDSYAERTDIKKAESQPQEHIPDNAGMESKTIRYDMMFHDNVNNVGTSNYKEQQDELLQICEDNSILKIEAVNTIVGSYGIHREGETSITMPKTMTNKTRKKAPTKRTKKNSQLLVDNKKEDLKKTANCSKTIKQKTTRKTKKTTLLPTNVNKTHRQINEELRNSIKLGSGKNETRIYLKNVLPSAICIQSDDNKQELSQYHLDNNALQHSDYNGMKYTNREIMSTNSDPWLLAPTSARNVTLNNNIASMQTEARFTNDRQYSTSTDHNWKQNENPYMSSSINFTEPYNLSVSENKACYNIHDPNCMWDNIYNNPRDFSNNIFQQTPTNIASNYITSTATPNNSLNATSGLFNPFHYQPLQTDSNLKKCYTNLGTMNYGNNNACEMMSMIKGNAMSLQTSDISAWHHVNDITASNRSNNLNIPFNAPMASWSDILSSYPLYTGNNISASTNTSAQFNDQYSRDTVRSNLLNQYRERENFINLYAGPVLENTLPAIDMHALNPYKDDGLTNSLSHERSTLNNGENGIMSDITNLLSETDSAEISKELNL